MKEKKFRESHLFDCLKSTKFYEFEESHYDRPSKHKDKEYHHRHQPNHEHDDHQILKDMDCACICNYCGHNPCEIQIIKIIQKPCSCNLDHFYHSNFKYKKKSKY